MHTIGLLVLLVMALVSGVLVARWRFATTPAERVYSALEIHTLLVRNPSALEGRMVLVRGQALGPATVAPPVRCPPGSFCANEPVLELPITTIDGELGVNWTPPGGWSPQRRSLYMHPGQATPLTATVPLAASLPDVGRLLTRSQRLVWHRPETYRVQILSHRVCVLQECYEAVLPDTVSPDDRQIAFDSTNYLAPRFGP